MIESRKGTVNVSGTRTEIIADLKVLFYSLIKNNVLTKEKLIDAVNNCDFKSDEQKEKTDESILRTIDMVTTLLKTAKTDEEKQNAKELAEELRELIRLNELLYGGKEDE